MRAIAINDLANKAEDCIKNTSNWLDEFSK
jgi:hypothetical protein